MVNYSQAKIYKIVDNTNGTIYVGSTCEPTLARRLAGHVGSYKSYLNGQYHYVTSFKILENNNYEIVLLEKCDGVTSKDELKLRERHYIETLTCVNKYIPLRTTKEYYETHKEKKRENDKIWREANKEKKRFLEKQWEEANKEKRKEYHKIWRANKISNEQNNI